MTQAISHLITEGNAFDFLQNEEELYSLTDIKNLAIMNKGDIVLINFPAKYDSFGVKDDSFGVKYDYFGAKYDSFGVKDDSFGAKDDSFGAKYDYFGVKYDYFGAKYDYFGKISIEYLFFHN